MWTGENGGSASLCGRAKTEVFENDYVTGIGMSQLKNQNGCFFIRFRWSSLDGQKRCKNVSVDEKLFIRFQKTENGGFRKRIRELTNRRLLHDDAVGLRDMSTAHAFLGTYRRRAKVDDVGESDLPAS